uniref:Aspartate aminotransferase n=1 Tax=Romanomermis culicivorax TaxID=13658 RepID=A0A915J3T1_ROMCU
MSSFDEFSAKLTFRGTMVATHNITSHFAEIKVGPPIEVFQVNKSFQDDKDPKKVNLSIGAYRDDQGKPWVLPAVREAERSLAADNSLNHEYFPILGFEAFSQAATLLLLGEDHGAIKENRAFGIQSLSGTGCLRIGADFLFRVLNRRIVYVSAPTWGNHHLLFRSAGFEVREYRYWDAKNRCVDFEGLLQDMENAPENSVIVLHGCAHNPTGIDLSQKQWMDLHIVMKQKRLFPFFDIAYQGFASGNLDADAWSVRYFASQGMEAFVAQSFAKNFGLYNERVGNLTVVVSNPNTIPAIKSQMTLTIRATYSNPPAHAQQVEILATKFHIYLLKSGRISVAGLNKGNVEYVAKAIHESVISTTN